MNVPLGSSEIHHSRHRTPAAQFPKLTEDYVSSHVRPPCWQLSLSSTPGTPGTF